MKKSLSELMDLMSFDVIDYDEDVVAELTEHSDDYIRHIDFTMVFCDDPYELFLLGKLRDYIVSLYSEV